MWQSLYMMFPSLWEHFTPEHIEDISNGMTLSAGDHREFREMEVGLKHLVSLPPLIVVHLLICSTV